MRSLSALMACLALGGCATELTSGPQFLTPAGFVGEVTLPMNSMEERRFIGVIRQQYDFSCGSAALATLLRYHYDYKVAEENAFLGMWARGDQEQIRQVGFSLLDMKRWLASRGISADGYQVSLDQIAQAGVPGIALIAIENYRHFVVIKGVKRGEVLLGDPSAGLTVMPRDEFEKAWNGIYFVLANDQPLGRNRFNRDAQWASYARAPLGSPQAEPVSLQMLMLTAPAYGDFS